MKVIKLILIYTALIVVLIVGVTGIQIGFAKFFAKDDKQAEIQNLQSQKLKLEIGILQGRCGK